MAVQTVSTVRAAAFRSRCLGKDLFDRIEVGWVFWQKEQLGVGGADELTHDLTFVTAEIVHDDDISGPESGQQDLLDIGPEACAVDRPLDEPWCIDPVMAQGRQEGHGLSAAMRC